MSDENDTTELFQLDDGYSPMFGHNPPDVMRFAAAPAWDEANPVLPESEWEEHDDMAAFNSPIRAQQNNNCTNAAIAGLGEALLRSQGVEDVPELSWSFLYARNNGGRDQGAMCRDVALDLKRVGCATRVMVPDREIYMPRGGFSQQVMDNAAEFEALEIYQCLNWQHVGSALTKRFFVYHGFALGNGYQRTGKDGKVPEWDGSTRNGHAMFSRGLTKKFGNWRTITPNTWGVNWGDHGIGYWPASYFWDERGNYVNLDAYAVRAMKHKGKLPAAA